MKYLSVAFLFVLMFANSFAQADSCAVSIDAVKDSSCAGVSYQLNATPGYTSYSWSPTTGLNNPSIPNPIATPSVTTTYTVTISNVVSGGGTNLIPNPDF